MLGRVQGASRRAEDGAMGFAHPGHVLRAALRGLRLSREGKKGSVDMLRIHSDAVALIRELREVVGSIARKDANLGDQLRRSLSSIGANIGEGSYAQGKKRHSHYFIAMASAREAWTHLEIAEAWGYCGPVSFETSERFKRIIGSLHRIVV